ncbi:MAG: FecR domain-containing protein [Bryobacteraceae bacterium]
MSTNLAAQTVISAKAGLIHYAEGDVVLGEKNVAPKFGEYPEMKEMQTLRTGLGRAEVLLTPGVFLRLAENSSFRISSNSLVDLRLEVLSGSALIEAAEVTKESPIAVKAGEYTLEIRKRGLFRLDLSTGMVRAYDGEIMISSAGQMMTLKEGRQTSLSTLLAPERFSPEKFSKDTGDAFHRWAGRRSGYLAAANLTAAKRAYDNGSGWRTSGWQYNPYFGSFTYLPGRGVYVSPFGYSYYSPHNVETVYYRPAPMLGMQSPNLDAGMRQYPDSGSRGYSGSGGGGYAAAPAPSAAPAAAAAPPRSADSGSSRESGGGRR